MNIIDFDEGGAILPAPGTYSGGTVVSGGWDKVAKDLVAVGWGRLHANEYCQQLKISDEGIVMVIGRRTEPR